MNTHSSVVSRPRGFTLIELLTVIAIIGILAAIIIPTVGAVRQTAREAKNISNLRQIALTLNILANDNKDRFPSAGNQTVDGNYVQHWKTEVGKYLLNTTSNNWIDRDNIFVSPTAANPVDPALTTKPCHYSLHPLLAAPNDQVPNGIKRSAVKRPSQVILVGDSSQSDTQGQNAAECFSTPAAFRQANVTNALDEFIPAPAAENVDTTRGVLRYRNRDSVHVGMVDGSARAIKRGAVTYGNIAANQ